MSGYVMPFSDNYNSIDRFLHRFAFCSPIVQKVLAELEGDIFRKKLTSTTSQYEVFVTGLPRAGTTLMLDLLHSTGEFSSFTYRDMPFILAPVLWNKMSHTFQKSSETQERAHGDGVKVSVDSPEAFDEVVWLTYMGKHIVSEDRLNVVTTDDIEDQVSEALRSSVRRLLARSGSGESGPEKTRYLSKNNANISRIDALRSVFPTAKVLIVFREPLAHVSSLSRQHARFLKEHADDKFSKKYMRWIGHYEFGENFRPINFNGWLGKSASTKDIDAGFWLQYWDAAYSYALDHEQEGVIFVDFDVLLRDSANVLQKIATSLGIENPEKLRQAGSRLRSPTTRPIAPEQCPSADLERAIATHQRLRSVAL